MKLSKLLELVEIAKKAEGTFDPEVLVVFKEKCYPIDHTAVLGSCHLIIADSSEYVRMNDLYPDDH